MTTKQETNISELKQFSSLPAPLRDAVILKNAGKTNKYISEALTTEHDYKKSEDTVRGWFVPGGKLEQALHDYSDALADAALEEAKVIAKRLTKTAILTMGELMGSAHADNIRLGASEAISNKYLPDKQEVVVDVRKNDNIPDAVRAAMEDELNGASNSNDTSAPSPEPGQPGGEGASVDDRGEDRPLDS